MAYTTIDNPELYFQTKLYTGAGGSQAQTLDGSEDMAPDMVWIKCRNQAENHGIYDTVRGATELLVPHFTAAETTLSTGLTAFGSDGFTVAGSGTTGYASQTYVAWCWKGGTTSGITTTGADITPSGYSFNHTSRFSIAAYTGNGTSGAKIAHGLGAIPEVMIIKPRDRAGQAWVVYHHKNTSAPETDYLALDATDVTADGAWPWNDAVPTSVYLETQLNNGTNASGSTFMLYTFRGVQGYSKFGSYIGNASADGPFCFCGFRPAYVMIKRTDVAAGWYMYDNKRAGYNGSSGYLQANSTSAEDTNATNFGFDILANGFKLKGTYATVNASGGTYIYMAFAEQPFVNSNGVPCNAR